MMLSETEGDEKNVLQSNNKKSIIPIKTDNEWVFIITSEDINFISSPVATWVIVARLGCLTWVATARS